MEAHFGRDTETLERTGTDLSHLFCSPCVAKAPQGLFLTRCDNATTRWDKEVGQRGGKRWDRQANCRRGGTGKPTAEVGHIEVGQASQPEGADVEVGQASQPEGADEVGQASQLPNEVGQASQLPRWDTSRWDRQANRRAPSKIMDRQAKITILSERCAVLDWVPSSGLDWTPRRTAIIESSRSRATGFRTRRTLLVRRSACRRRRMSARIVSTPLPRARSSHARESRAFQV